MKDLMLAKKKGDMKTSKVLVADKQNGGSSREQLIIINQPSFACVVPVSNTLRIRIGGDPGRLVLLLLRLGHGGGEFWELTHGGRKMIKNRTCTKGNKNEATAHESVRNAFRLLAGCSYQAASVEHENQYHPPPPRSILRAKREMAGVERQVTPGLADVARRGGT